MRIWYEPIARQWLAAQFRHLGEIRLIVDGTKIGSGHQLLIVCLAYRKRAIPIAWTWVKHVRGHSNARKQLALLAYVRSLIPAGAAVFLVGDCEFGSVAVLRQLDRWHWFYVLRQKSDTCLWFSEQEGWLTFGSHIQKAGTKPSGWVTRLSDDQPYLSGQLAGSLESAAKKNPGAWQPTCLTNVWPCDFTLADRGSKRCSVTLKTWF